MVPWGKYSSHGGQSSEAPGSRMRKGRKHTCGGALLLSFLGEAMGQASGLGVTS